MANSSSTSNSKSTLRRWPFAALYTLGLCIALTCIAWIAIALSVNHDKKRLLFIGDSFTGNYRFEPGQRLHDLLQNKLGTQWEVLNVARPGARTLDMLMQVHQAETLIGDSDVVVLPLYAHKFVVGNNYIRLDKRGDNLKWLHLNTRLLPVAETFDDELRKKLLIHKLGLLLGFYDLLEFLYVEHIQNPIERKQMRANSTSRRRKINAKIQRYADIWNDLTLNPITFPDAQPAKDLSLLVNDLKAQNTPLLIVLLPAGNMDAVRSTFSSRAQTNLEHARLLTLAWCKQHEVPYVDLTRSIPGRFYDDFAHLKEVEGNAVVTQAVHTWLAAQQ